MDKITFKKHKEETAKDCEAVAQMLTLLANDIREGDFRAFESFWLKGGTEEGDAKIQEVRERIVLRYLVRCEKING